MSNILPMFSFLPRMSFLLPCLENFCDYFKTQVKFDLLSQFLSNFAHFVLLEDFIHSLGIEPSQFTAKFLFLCLSIPDRKPGSRAWKGRITSMGFWIPRALEWSSGLPRTLYTGCEPQSPYLENRDMRTSIIRGC